MPRLLHRLNAPMIGVLLIAGLARTSRADFQFTRIAWNAPGSGFGTPSNTTFGLPALNNRGDVAFGTTASSGGGVNGTFVGRNGLVRTVADEASTAPAINEAGTVLYTTPIQPITGQSTFVRSVTASGQATNHAAIPSPSITRNGSINNLGVVSYVSYGNPNTTVNRAQGTNVTVVASGLGTVFSPVQPALDDANITAFRVGFSPTLSTIVTVDSAGTQRTLTRPAGTFSALDPALNENGLVAYAALGGPDRIVTQSAAGGTPTVRISAGSGYGALGYLASTTGLQGQNFSGVALNNRDQLAFLAQTTSPTQFGIYTGPSATADRVIAVGDALFGSTVTELGFHREGFNDAGQVAFVARLATGVTAVVLANPPGTMAGMTQFNPILPDNIVNGVFTFTNVPTGMWFDPPLVPGFFYEMTSAGSLFTRILDFPYGFDAPFQVLVDGVSLGSYLPGQSVDFTGLAGGGVRSFTILGLSPLADADDPRAFPLRLAFSTPTASFRMSAVPEPTALLMTFA